MKNNNNDRLKIFWFVQCNKTDKRSITEKMQTKCYPRMNPFCIPVVQHPEKLENTI